jgi:hypothetical protein
MQTPHVPHCWEAGLLYEITNSALLCSDLFHQNGDVEPWTANDVIDRVRETLIEYQNGPLANYLPYTPNTQGTLERLAELKPRTLAAMHGSAYGGDGEKAIRDYAAVLNEVYGRAD